MPKPAWDVIGGPWTVGRKVDRCVYGSDGTPICEVDSMGEASRDLERSTARLIAAAPDLYVQLRMLVRWAEDQGETCAFARAALARADGGRDA